MVRLPIVLVALVAAAAACGARAADGGAHERQKLVARDAAAKDIYGAAVAIHGDVLVVAAEYDDLAGEDSGAVHVYRRDGATWKFEQKLAPPDGAAGDNFGRAVDVFGDVIVVGAHWDDTEDGANAGSAYVFRRAGGTWNHEAKLTPRDGRPNARFGVTVSTTRDGGGERIAVGAWLDGGAGKGAGAAYVFRQTDGGEWVQEQRLLPADSHPGANFGRSVSLSGDRLAVGAWGANARGASSGAAWIFRREGGRWTEEAKLVGDGVRPGHRMGFGVALDGDLAVVGAHEDGAGCAYVFRRAGNAWKQDARLVAPGGSAGDSFGWAVAVLGDRALVGAHQADVAGENSGAAHVFRRTAGGWTHERRLTSSDLAAGDTFGFHLDLNAHVAVVGAWRDDHAGHESGSAYAFDLD